MTGAHFTLGGAEILPLNLRDPLERLKGEGGETAGEQGGNRGERST